MKEYKAYSSTQNRGDLEFSSGGRNSVGEFIFNDNAKGNPTAIGGEPPKQGKPCNNQPNPDSGAGSGLGAPPCSHSDMIWAQKQGVTWGQVFNLILQKLFYGSKGLMTLVPVSRPDKTVSSSGLLYLSRKCPPLNARIAQFLNWRISRKKHHCRTEKNL